MSVRYDRPVSVSARLAGQFGVFSITMLVVVFLWHRFGPLTDPDFVGLILVAAIPAAFAVPLAIIGLCQLWYSGAYGGLKAARGLILGLFPLALVGFAAYRFIVLPPIYDVSTDLVEPPRWIVTPDAAQKWLPDRPEITPQMREAQLNAYPALNGRRYEGALDRVYEAVLKVAQQNGFKVMESLGEEYAAPELTPEQEKDLEASVEAPGGAVAPDVGPVPSPRPEPAPPGVEPSLNPPGIVRLQVDTRSLFFGFPFDAVIRLREEAETTLVDIRVASRYGPHDLGFSAEIAQRFLHALDAELLGIAGG